MNKQSRVISVNPGRATVGELRQRVLASIEPAARKMNAPFRFPVIDSIEKSDLSLRNTLRLFFGVTGIRSGMTAPKDSVTLLARIGLGLFLLFCGLIANTPVAPLFIAFGVMLMLGLCNRMLLISLFIIEAVSVHAVYAAGAVDYTAYTSLVLSVISLVMAIAGPGHISLDSVIERGIFKEVTSSRRRRKIRNRVSYQAYKYADYGA